MKKAVLIDETGADNENNIFLLLIYFPNDGKDLLFKDFYNDLDELDKKLSAISTKVVGPVIGARLPFPTRTKEFFTAQMYCSKDDAYNIDPSKPFFQILKEMGYHTILGYRSPQNVDIKEIKERL